MRFGGLKVFKGYNYGLCFLQVGNEVPPMIKEVGLKESLFMQRLRLARFIPGRLTSSKPTGNSTASDSEFLAGKQDAVKSGESPRLVIRKPMPKRNRCQSSLHFFEVRRCKQIPQKLLIVVLPRNARPVNCAFHLADISRTLGIIRIPEH